MLETVPPTFRMTVHEEAGPVEVRGGDLQAQADEIAARLQRHRIGPGDRVGILGPNHHRWLASAFGIWRAGAVMVSIAYPLRIRSADTVGAHVRALVEAAECRAVLADPGFEAIAPAGRTIDWTEGTEAGPSAVSIRPQDPASIQFTSGSTASPKGALLSHGAILAALTALLPTSGFGPGTRAVSWQPLFHDMGVYGFPLPAILGGYELDLMTTEAFARDPASWFRLATDRSATCIASPSSAWAAAIRQAQRDPAGIELSSIDRAVFGGDIVHPSTLDLVREWGATVGLPSRALAVSYGMAEATVGTTFTPLGQEPRVLEVDADALLQGRAEPPGTGGAKRLVSCGLPTTGVEVRIGDPRTPMPEDRLGDIFICTDALMDRYVGPDAEDTFVDEWLPTGDIGFLNQGELVISGRSKDLIIMFGRNYAPEDLEFAAATVEGVRPGRVVAFSPADEEGQVVVVVEPRGAANPEELRVLVRRAVADEVGLTPNRVVVVPPDTIPKTTSGKLQRSRVREAFERGELPV
jgi:fatty-acyl-CoA synthase